MGPLEASNNTNIENLGIATNIEGIDHPMCGKQRKECGRKSHVELISIDIGMDGNKKKINDLLNVGKWNFLPMDP